MKIIKGTPTFDAKAIARITGEMINTQYCQTLYTDGQYVPFTEDMKLNKFDYNTYDINGVAYEVHPTRGIVIIASGREPYNVKTLIEQQYSAMRDHIIMMGRTSKIPVASKGTTQYLVIDTPKSINKAKLIYVNSRDKPLSDALDDDETSFIWYIYLTSNLNQAPMNIPYFTQGQNEHCILSLSAIIYDDRNIFALPHGYKSADYPMIYDYNIWRTGNIVEHAVYYHSMSGICIEIARHYLPTDAIEFSFIDAVAKASSQQHKATIYWLKWQEAKIKKVLPHSEVSLIEQLKVIDDIPYYDTESAESHKAENYVCCMTGMPIYEDCYVLDIYESKNQDGNIIAHDSPIRLLVSPFYIHYYSNRKLSESLAIKPNTCNNVNVFEKLTNTKCILYRTFCPIRAKDIIMSFNENYFSATYKKALIAIDRGITLVRRDYTTGESVDADGHKYVIKSDINKFDPIEKDTTVIMASGSYQSYLDEDYDGFRVNA